jgi:hypothetical protein
MEAQAIIVTEHIRASSRVKLAQNVVAAAFILMAGLCVLFAPSGREVVAEIVGVAFLVLGAGIAGFTNLRVRIPKVDLTASSEPLRPSGQRRPRTPPQLDTNQTEGGQLHPRNPPDAG